MIIKTFFTSIATEVFFFY